MLHCLKKLKKRSVYIAPKKLHRHKNFKQFQFIFEWLLSRLARYLDVEWINLMSLVSQFYCFFAKRPQIPLLCVRKIEVWSQKFRKGNLLLPYSFVVQLHKTSNHAHVPSISKNSFHERSEWVHQYYRNGLRSFISLTAINWDRNYIRLLGVNPFVIPWIFLSKYFRPERDNLNPSQQTFLHIFL